MSDTDHPRATLPLDQFPEPACQYTIEDGERVVSATNQSFDDRFGGTTEGRSLSAVFDERHVDIVGSHSLSSALAADQFVVESGATDQQEGRRYLVERVPERDGEGGSLVFVESPEVVVSGETPEPIDVDHIATIVSHDLRNPLDVAKSRLRAGRELDEDEHFEHVEWAHERMERIIEDVLTLARTDLEPRADETVNLETVARTAWQTVETADATLTIEGPLPEAVADADRVSRLFENLFRNCIEHGGTSRQSAAVADGSTDTVSETGDTDPDADESGAVSVTVGPLDGAAAPGFYVEDDGPGIPEEDRARVFEPGYSRDENGTGLGLSIVSRIADIYDWSISVGEGVAGGARFEITDLGPDESD